MKTKIEPLVNVNVNPCKMCMPMGAMTAFCGIEGCMSILHGSQGCATYIRRHMATHYNEPIDIASSSLTEHGTVYGGEDNLKKGLLNLIELYQPKIIGVATTCLAETIGEDCKRIIYNFRTEHPEYDAIEIVLVQTAGYAGTQFEGYFRTLHSIVSQIKQDTTPNQKINVITTELSPADTRILKEVFADFGLDIILLPDLSENLDGVFQETYERLPEHGTKLEDIRQMAGARCTIELTSIPQEPSPWFSWEKPCYRLGLPGNLRDINAFLNLLSTISGKEIPEKYKVQKGRYLDAMIDSHKYNGEGRTVIYGNPDFLITTVRLCVENGILPVVVATGVEFPNLKEYLLKEIEPLADLYFVEDISILDDTDFKEIEAMAVKNKANVMIGNSDGRRIEEQLGLPLVRRGFPIHDRIGGQRLKTLMFEGALSFLDEITNVIINRTESSFRQMLFRTYYKGEQNLEKEEVIVKEKTLEEKTLTHPCYNCAGHKYARMHLPIAPACNIQCNYCVRKFDCPNESRPGVTTQVLTPEEAFEKYKIVKEKVPNLTVVGIAGPGDALANFPETKKTLELIREYDKDVTFCLSTNGLMLPNYAEDLVKLGVTHLTVTINAIDPKIGAKIYKHIVYMGTKFEGESAAAILLSNQLAGLRIMIAHGIICKVNIVTLKGINDTHIPEVVEKMKEIGCFITNIMPMIPVQGSAFENNPVASNKEIEKLRETCALTMNQMTHCRQCRADAIGTLDQDQSLDFRGYQPTADSETNETIRFAVASKSGMYVDQHFGHVTEWYIYDYQNGEVKYFEKRKVLPYCTGVEECDEAESKIQGIIQSVEDCQAVIVLRVGEAPKKKLMEKNIQIITTYDRLEDAIKNAVIKK